MDTTVYRAIENPEGTIQLSDLWSDSKGKWYKEPALHFKEADNDMAFWDNHLYVYKFLRGLKKGKMKAEEELRTFCNENNLLYNETKQSLIEIYKTSKKLKFWKK